MPEIYMLVSTDHLVVSWASSLGTPDEFIIWFARDRVSEGGRQGCQNILRELDLLDA